MTHTINIRKFIVICRKMPSDMSGKTAIITGSSRGIGAAVAIRLAEHGANVVINYNSSSKQAEDVAQKCRSHGVKAIVVQADVSQASEVEKLFKMGKAEFGRIDIVMSNSGIIHFGAPNEVTSEEFDKVSCKSASHFSTHFTICTGICH
jgi:NAD(P)-dependent dehydrogenase (short-subunit alcohol dehydrogenase family)